MNRIQIKLLSVMINKLKPVQLKILICLLLRVMEKMLDGKLTVTSAETGLEREHYGANFNVL